nr:type VI secretion system baseplate subunit TssF [uncultured Lichenicoccus sp.]
MSDRLLPYYDRERDAIGKLAAEFARTYPKIAGRLRLTEDAVDDPHVARLLDGAAFLAARVHQRLDDEFPELTEALLGVLYPHYLAPVPSGAIIQLACQPGQAAALRVPAGRLLDTIERVGGETCRFRTTSDVTLWPIEIDGVRLSGLPLAAPANPRAERAQSVLRIALRCADPMMEFGRLGLDTLRFFIRGKSNLSRPLHELLCAHTMSVALADSATDASPVLLPGSILTQAGFAAEDALLPFPKRSFSAFRLLTELFALPEKFLFFDLARLDAKTLRGAGNRLEIFIYLDCAMTELERLVDDGALALGCTPVINLFMQRCEPITLTHATTEYRIEPDVRRPGILEVWQVEQVRETRSDGTATAWQPFYRLHQTATESPAGGFYAVSRRNSVGSGGTDLFLAPFDPRFDADGAADAVLSIDALCSNRDLPKELPFAIGRLGLRFVDGLAAVTRITCLTAPTSSLPAPLRAEGFWPLVSHLSLGHLSVVGGETAAQALREVLRLYDLRGADDTRKDVEALLSVRSSPGVARVPGARPGAFCRGLDVVLEWDATLWAGGSLFLLASVLERFLALHATVNSFVRTRCVLRGRPETVASWPPRAGSQVLL